MGHRNQDGVEVLLRLAVRPLGGCRFGTCYEDIQTKAHAQFMLVGVDRLAGPPLRYFLLFKDNPNRKKQEQMTGSPGPGLAEEGL